MKINMYKLFKPCKALFIISSLLLTSPLYAQSIPNIAGATGWYSAFGTKTDTNGGTLTNGKIPGTDISNSMALAAGATTARTPASHFSDTIDVLDYGAVPNPTIDNTASIQNAINAACSIVSTSSNGTEYPSGSSTGGGDVFIPQGKYGIVGPLNWTCPVRIHGAGRGTTTLVWIGSGSSSLFNMLAPLTDSGRFWRDGAVYDLDVVDGGSQTGAVWHIASCTQCEIYNVQTYGVYRAFVNYAGFHVDLHDFNFTQMHTQATNGVSSGTEAFSTAIEFYGSDNNGGAGCTASNNGNCLTRADILSIYNGSVDSSLNSTNQPSDCIYMHDFAATMWVKNLNCNQTRIGLNIRCDNSVAIGNCPQFIQLDRWENESNDPTGNKGNANIAADNFAAVTIVDAALYQSTPGNNNITLNNTRFHSGNFQIFGGKIQNALGMCIVSRIDGFQMHGGVVTQCGQDGVSGDEWGIGFGAGTTNNATNNLVDGVQFCHDNVGGQTSMRPVNISSSATYTEVANSGLQNCAGASTNQNSSGNNLIVNEVGP